MMLSRLIWPTGALFGATLWFVFATILQTGEGVTALAIARQQSALSLAVERDLALRLDAMGDLVERRLAGQSAGPGVTSERAVALAAELAGHQNLDAILVITPDWEVLGGSAHGRPLAATDIPALKDGLAAIVAETRGRLAGDVMAGDAWDPRRLRAASAIRLQADEDGLAAAAAMPLAWVAGSGQGTRRLLLAGLRRLSPEAVAKIAGPHGLEQIALATETPSEGGAALRIPTVRPDRSAWLTWTSERPGDVLRERLIPLTLAAFGLVLTLFLAVAGYLHWLARDLARTEARSRDLLGRDPLSGLANRLLFSERLDRELAALRPDGAGLAVHFIDLDRFKDVNDTHGHQAGDDLIQLVAQRLVNTLRSCDTLARFGGDEFAVIQTGVEAPDMAAAQARRVLEALTRPFVLAHGEVIIGASIGIALAPQHGESREALMGLADTALYQAKTEGRNRFIFFQSRMDETIRMRKVVEEDLRTAIAEDRLQLHYQPLFSADGRRIVALEALVRWPHPVRGMISPAEFVPVAEERGLIIPLGDWVMRRACQDGMRWPGIRIAVNVSPIQFRHRDFVAGVMATLRETGLEPDRLELELTEGVVVGDADAAESAMVELRRHGVHLALDDFGTGYSSLIYLRRFAFDTIKIDRSFLESMDATGESAILVHSMVHLGRALGLTVTAEGVETEEQHRFLQALGCHQLQGYLFSKPLPPAEIERLLAAEAALAKAA